MGLIEFSFSAAAEREIVSDANEKSCYDLRYPCGTTLWRRMFPLLQEVLFRTVFRYEASGSTASRHANVDIQCRVNSGTTMSPEILNA